MKKLARIVSFCIPAFTLIIFASCHKGDHLAVADANQQFNNFSENPVVLGTREFQETTGIYSTMQLAVDRNSQDFVSIGQMEKSKEFSSKFYPRHTQIQINGHGGGWSEQYGRVITDLEILYAHDSGISRGVVHFLKEDGSQISYNLQSNKLLSTIELFDGPHVALIMNGVRDNDPHQRLNGSPEITAYLLDADLLLNPEVREFEALFIIEENKQQDK